MPAPTAAGGKSIRVDKVADRSPAMFGCCNGLLGNRPLGLFQVPGSQMLNIRELIQELGRLFRSMAEYHAGCHVTTLVRTLHDPRDERILNVQQFDLIATQMFEQPTRKRRLFDCVGTAPAPSPADPPGETMQCQLR